MDTITSKVEQYTATLTTYVRGLAKQYNEALGSSGDYYAIVDTVEHHFQFLRMGWQKDQFSFVVLIHLSIHSDTGNIWIQQNNTERLIDEDLRELIDLPNDHLVLGFLPEYMRVHSAYGVA